MNSNDIEKGFPMFITTNVNHLTTRDVKNIKNPENLTQSECIKLIKIFVYSKLDLKKYIGEMMSLITLHRTNTWNGTIVFMSNNYKYNFDYKHYLIHLDYCDMVCVTSNHTKYYINNDNDKFIVSFNYISAESS